MEAFDGYIEQMIYNSRAPKLFSANSIVQVN